MRDRLPVISDDRVLQVLNTEEAKLTLVLWMDGKQPQVFVEGRAGMVERFDTIEVPSHIRGELKDGGFVTPPKKILWIRARFEQPFARGKSTQVQVKTGDVANPTAISVNLFTS